LNPHIVFSHFSVSILVFLELAPGLLGDLLQHPAGAVSILVFLELAPGLVDEGPAPALDFRFQSLFFWNSRPDATEPKD